MADDFLQLRLDSVDFIKQLQRVERAFKRTYDIAGKVVSVMQTTSKAGTQLKGVFEGLTSSGDKARVTFAVLGQQVKQLGIRYVKTAKELAEAERKRKREQEQALKREQQIQEQRKRLLLEANRFTWNLQRRADFTQATLQEKQAYADALAKLKQLAVQHNLTGKRINKIWGDVVKGNLRAYSRVELQRLQTQLVKIKQAHERLGEAARKAAERELAAQRRAEEARKKHEEYLKRVILNWQNIGRIIALQLAHKAITKLTSSLREAVQITTELSRRLAEVMTIDTARMGLETWAVRLREVSEAFGVDILDQVESAYQTLSNQIAKGAETTRFLAEAARFSTASVSTMTDSVKLLSAVLNSYNLDLRETRRVAATFFKAIELGRIRASDMADTIGRVTALSSKLGISYKEVAAMLANLTIKGIKYNEAMTQMRGFMLKLIKPTKEMKALFDELGVSTGEEAIKTYGLIGFLRILQERTKGSSTELAKYVNRIRGLLGLISFTGEGLTELEQTIKKFADASQTYTRAIDLVMSSMGKQWDIFVQKVKNYFLFDLARPVMRFVAEGTHGFQVFMGVVKLFTRMVGASLVPLLVSTVAQFHKFITDANTLLAMKFASGIGLITLAFLSLKGAIEEVREIHAKSWDLVIKKAQEAYDSTIQYIDAVTEHYKKALTNRLLLVTRHVNKVLLAYRNLLTDIELAFNEAGKRLKETFTNIVDHYTKEVNRFKSEIRKLQQDIARLRGEQVTSKFKLEQQLFGIQLQRVPDINKLALISDRMTELLRRAAKAQDIKTFNMLINRVNDLMSQRVSLIQQLENEGELVQGQVDIQTELVNLVEKENQLRDQLIKKLEAQAKLKEQELKAAEKQKDMVAGLVQQYTSFDFNKLLKQQEEYNKQTGQLDTHILETGIKKQQKLLQQLANEWLKVNKNATLSERFTFTTQIIAQQRALEQWLKTQAARLQIKGAKEAYEAQKRQLMDLANREQKITEQVAKRRELAIEAQNLAMAQLEREGKGILRPEVIARGYLYEKYKYREGMGFEVTKVPLDPAQKALSQLILAINKGKLTRAQIADIRGVVSQIIAQEPTPALVKLDTTLANLQKIWNIDAEKRLKAIREQQQIAQQQLTQTEELLTQLTNGADIQAQLNISIQDNTNALNTLTDKIDELINRLGQNAPPISANINVQGGNAHDLALAIRDELGRLQREGLARVG